MIMNQSFIVNVCVSVAIGSKRFFSCSRLLFINFRFNYAQSKGVVFLDFLVKEYHGNNSVLSHPANYYFVKYDFTCTFTFDTID